MAKKDNKKDKNKKTVPLDKAERYEVSAERGLSQGQVDLRNEDGLTNYVDKKTGKSYLQIFLTNIFTFFNRILHRRAPGIRAMQDAHGSDGSDR